MNLPFQAKWMCKEKWMHVGALRQNIFLFSLINVGQFDQLSALNNPNQNEQVLHSISKLSTLFWEIT